MLGWWVILSSATPQERDADRNATDKNLATWETGVQGMRWLNDLVAEGQAREESLKGGYPNRYSATAEVLLPLFRGGPPLSSGMDALAQDEHTGETRLVPGDENWDVTLHPDRMAACSPEQVLTLEVWDQS